MTDLDDTLQTRREEFDEHFALAKALEDRVMLGAEATLGSIRLAARHINVAKSALIIHLYNIEEALMTEIMDLLGGELGAVEPKRWSEHSLREWLRECVVSRINEGDEDGKLDTIFNTSLKLRMELAPGPQKLKKPSGTWDDKLVATFARRMNVNFRMPPEMWQRIAASPRYGDSTPLQFLAQRRNAIAHGKRSFEEGASDLRLEDIRELAGITLDYLECAARAFKEHVQNAAHLSPVI